MRDDDALENNPHISRKALEGLHSQLFGWTLSRCNFERAVAEDLMQQAYVEVLSGRARFDNKSALKTFLFGVVQNLARSRFRRLSTRLRLLVSYGPQEEPFSQQPEPGAERETRLVWRAVAALPARQRDITELVFCREMTVEQAATVMGVTVGTARVHYDRAKKALAVKLAELAGRSP
ncbi:MAG: RNA polymerase sigma factor [Gammaproteobacteria bacterium]|nr:RNA polymerase sigma factor [Gammaproteobacteria bacterium]